MSPVQRILAFLLTTVVVLPAAPLTRHFDFGATATANDWLPVNADTFYSSSRGYGFESGAVITSTNPTTAAAPRDNFCTSEKPFFFSVALPEGNYRVTLTLGDRAGESHTTVKAESRRLIVPAVDTKRGEIITTTFIVNVRNAHLPDGAQVKLKPREIGAWHWDDRLTLEFNGARPCVAALEITTANDAITVFLAGDSTVTDQQLEPWSAWGQMLPAFFDDTVAVANHAESGETIKSFVGERRLEKIMSLIKPGDALFIQFGHNDQKQNAEHTDAATGYKDFLRRYISETKAKGAFPVLVTSMERRNFDANGHIKPSLEGYPQAMREVGLELAVPVLDLNAMSIPLYEALGPEGTKNAFVYFPANSFPNQPLALSDDTHFSSYGADQLARCLVEAIKAQLPSLAKHLRPGLPVYDPSHPMPFAARHLSASPSKPVVKPEGS